MSASCPQLTQGMRRADRLLGIFTRRLSDREGVKVGPLFGKPAEFAFRRGQCLAAVLGFAPVLGIGADASAPMLIAPGLACPAEASETMSAAPLRGPLVAQADPGPPPSPAALVTTQPP